MLLVAVLLFAGLTNQMVAATFQPTQNKLSCSAYRDGTIDDLQNDAENPCYLAGIRSEKNGLLWKLDIVQACTCQLVGKEVAWQSMINESIENMYQALVSHLSEQLRSTWNEYDFFQAYIKMIVDSSDAALTRRSILDSFKSKYKYSLTGRNSIERLDDKQKVDRLEHACNMHLAKFGLIYKIMEQMAKTSENPRLAEELVTYSPNLFKGLVAFHSCHFLFSKVNPRLE